MLTGPATVTVKFVGKNALKLSVHEAVSELALNMV